MTLPDPTPPQRMPPRPLPPDPTPLAQAAPVRPASYGLQFMLIVLVLTTAVPMAALLAYAVHRESLAEVEKARALVQSLASVTAAEIATTLAELERTAAVLAERPRVRALDPTLCDPLAEELMLLDRNLANVGTVNRDGQAICTVLRPPTGVLPNIGNPPWFRRLKERGTFSIGAPQRGLYSGRWVVVTAYPLRGATHTGVMPGPDSITGAVQLVVGMPAFQPLVSASLPQGAIAGIADADGTIIARSEQAERLVGTQVRNPEVAQILREGRAASITARGGDGIERFYAYQPIGQSGWFTFIGLPAASVYAQAQRNAWRSGALALLVMIAAGLAVYAIHRRISAPMLALRLAARQAAGGRFDTRAPQAGPREVAEVAAGFNQLLERIPVMERELRQSEEHYRQLFDSSPVAMRVICDGRIVMVNPAYVSLFGVHGPETRSPNERVVATVHPDFRARALERLRIVLEERRPVPPDEQVLLRADGSNIEVEVATLPFEYEGKPAVVSIIHDLTARKAAERVIRQANADLEERVQQRTSELRRAITDLEAFSYTVAHDLRAPLRSITGFAALLQEQRDKLDADGRNFLERILASGETMDRLIDGLLALARLGRTDLNLTEVDLSSLADTVVRELLEREGEAGAKRHVEFAIQPGLRAWADARLIKDVLENLIGNAWKFTSSHASARIGFGLVNINGEAAYFVRDDGAGFNAAYMDKLFGAFQRLHARSEFPGTGIGLASVKRIIAHHGGTVWADGVVEGGAVFYFTLNARPA